jgi:hypothetical protein
VQVPGKCAEYSSLRCSRKPDAGIGGYSAAFLTAFSFVFNIMVTAAEYSN